MQKYDNNIVMVKVTYCTSRRRVHYATEPLLRQSVLVQHVNPAKCQGRRPYNFSWDYKLQFVHEREFFLNGTKLEGVEYTKR